MQTDFLNLSCHFAWEASSAGIIYIKVKNDTPCFLRYFLVRAYTKKTGLGDNGPLGEHYKSGGDWWNGIPMPTKNFLSHRKD